jgi:hypothetical protein
MKNSASFDTLLDIFFTFFILITAELFTNIVAKLGLNSPKKFYFYKCVLDFKPAAIARSALSIFSGNK